MSMFKNELKRLMALHGITSANVEAKSKRKIKYSQVQSFLRGSLPQQRSTIEDLAKLFSVDSADLKKLAITEMTDRLCEKFGISNNEVFGSLKQQSLAQRKLPVISIGDLPQFLSDAGTPIYNNATDYIDNFGNFDKNTYAIVVEDRTFGDCVAPGDFAIFNGDSKWKRNLDDYGIVGAKSGIFCGKLLEFSKAITVQKVEPYTVDFVENKEVIYIHRLIAMLRVSQKKRR